MIVELIQKLIAEEGRLRLPLTAMIWAVDYAISAKSTDQGTHWVAKNPTRDLNEPRTALFGQFCT